MQRKVSKEKLYYVGKTKASRDLVHQHMSNHYRKILNAKKAVDDGPPQSYKAKRPATSNSGMVKNKVNRQLESPALTDRSISTNSNKGSCWGTESYAGSSRYHVRCIPESPTFGCPTKHAVVDMELVNRITYDTKKGPASYCGEGWSGAKSRQNNKDYKTALNVKQSGVQKSYSTSTKRQLPTITLQESAQKRKFAVQQETENPSNPSINSPLDVSPYKCSKIAVDDSNDTVLKKITFNPKEQSLTSSRDSAYNGGVSSLPESRSPTPDERKKKECCCCCCGKKNRDAKFFKKSKPDRKTAESNAKACNQKVSGPSTQNQEETLKKIKEDELYVKFVQDITTEILEKNLYTNKALKNVMRKHIKSNLFKLNKERMLEEVEYLRAQLGIPKDQSFLQAEGNSEEIENDCPKSCISDSEFVMPKTLTKTSPDNKVTEIRIGNSCSATEDEKTPLGSGSENDRHVFSVIQAKEKKTPMVISRENSFEGSDRPFDSKNLSVFENLKKTSLRSSPSSSDSEIFIRKTWEKTKEEISENEELSLQGFGQNSCSKKNRNVSFWKNPELNLSRTGRCVEIKQKKTVIRNKESVCQDKKEKTKKTNDWGF